MKKLTLVLSMLIALVGLNANAAMYVMGDGPFGGWATDHGTLMTDNGDNTYTFVATISGSVYFCFADGLTENAEDWTGFNAYRFGPESGNQVVQAGNWISTQHGGGAYMFTGSGEEYEITFDSANSKFKIAGYVAPINPLTGHLYALGQVNGNGWNPAAGIEMTTTDENVFTLTDAEITNSGDGYGYFSFTSKLGANSSDWSFSSYRRGAKANGTLVEDGVPAVLADWGSTDAFKVVPGTYDIVVNLSGNTVTLTKKGETPPEPEPDVYIFGDVNNFAWNPTQGVLMTLTDSVYTATVNTTLRENEEKAYIGFTKMLADSVSENVWNEIAPYRFGPVSEGAFVMTEELLGIECDLATDGSYESIALPEGTWTVTVDLANNKFSVNGTWPVDTVIPEPETNVYIFGDVNNFAWDPTQGVLMTLTDSVYTATVNATLRENEEKAYIGFTKKLAEENNDAAWDEIAPFRFGPVSDGAFVMTEELLGIECDLATDGSYESIALPEGTWTVTVDLANNKFSVNGTWPVDTVIPEPETDLYIIGEVNDNGGWFTNKGVKMTLNEGVYTANITTAGENEGLSYFSFTKQLADSAADWEAIAPYRIGAVSEGDFLMTEELLGVECALVNNGEAIALPAGEWTVNVNLDTYKFTITGEWPVDTVIPEPETDLYIIGEVNDNGGWFTNKGVKMTLNEGVYTANITTAGENEGLSYFSFTKQLADSAADWEAIAPYRIGAVSEGDFLMTEELLGVECALVNNGEAIALPAGEWTVNVNLDTYKFTITGEWPSQPEEHYTGDVYILGEVNDNGGWFTNKGVKMTFDAENYLFTATITTAGENVPEGEETGYSYFSFTKQLADSAADWDAIAPYRFGAVSDGDFWVTDSILGTEISLQNGGQSFRVPAGEWNLTLNVDNMTLVIEKAESFIRGDVNGDQNVNIGDVTALINLILSKAEYTAVADCNNDNVLSVADVTILINRVLSGNWPE